MLLKLPGVAQGVSGPHDFAPQPKNFRPGLGAILPHPKGKVRVHPDDNGRGRRGALRHGQGPGARTLTFLEASFFRFL